MKRTDASRFILTRQWDTDADNKPFRHVLKDGKRFGRLYQHRASFGGRKVTNGFCFEFNGLPTRDPIVRKTLGEIYDELLLS
jgi:hypothetical protein